MLISGEELTRGTIIGVIGGVAGVCTVVYPGSPVWMLPAALAVGGCALTVPEIRDEVIKALPDAQQLRRLLTAPRPALPGQQAGSAAADRRQSLFEVLDEQPHRLVIGHTGGGKTTLLHSLALRWAASGSAVLVCDPDAAPGQWPRCRVAGHGDDYEAIGTALHLVENEIARRRQARAEGQRHFKPTYVIIDEAHDVIAEVPNAKPVIRSLARRGRKIGMRLTLGVQDSQARTLDLDGETALLRNFQTVDVLRQDDRRVAVVHRPEGKETIPVPELPDPEQFIHGSSESRAKPTAATSPDALLQSLLSQGVTSASERASNAHGVTVTVTDDDGNGNGNADNGVTVTVRAHAIAETPQRRSRYRRQGLNMRERRERNQEREMEQAYRTAGANGESFRQSYARIGGSRNKMLVAWQQGKGKGNERKTTGTGTPGN